MPQSTAALAPELPSLIGLSLAELGEQVAALGVPDLQAPMRARQLWHWLYHQGATDFEAMTSLPVDLRQGLAAGHRIARPKVVAEQQSADGTRKWLLGLDQGHTVEAVHIPETSRGTLCISTQVGCSLTCRFCHTGTMALVRNLDAAEILAQILPVDGVEGSIQPVGQVA